ncbi:MAG: D-alanine--D-alanine ligase [Desulfuromonas sp.]|nr:MAG: D-alanine--D-alanine ligase [Desulfuromonas sp.]
MNGSVERSALQQRRIGVLMGGLSAEREVSLRTGNAVLAALTDQGFDTVAIDAGRDLPGKLLEAGIELAFIALHGRFGEDGTVQGLLEIMEIPYTGSGVLASSLAMDKVMTKQLLLQNGIPSPDFVALRKGDDLESGMPSWDRFPAVVKPAREGSTIGVSIVRDPTQLSAGLQLAQQHDELVLVEDYIEGAELTVAVLNGEALPVIQIVPQSGFYDFQSKYTPGQTEYLLPAPLEADLYGRIQQAAQAACRALGCRGAARVDFMVRNNEFFTLEVNTIPGMTETSLLPKSAAAAGISFAELVLRIVEDAGLGK